MGNHINWKRMSPRRRAALAITSDVCTRFLMSSEYIKSLLNSSEEVEEEEEIDIRTELLVDTLSKSGISVRARSAILECFLIANNIPVAKYGIAKESQVNDIFTEVDRGDYKFLAIVPIRTFNSHSYPVTRPCILNGHVSNMSVVAMRYNGTVGNYLLCAPPHVGRNLTMPTSESLTDFFDTGLPLDRLDRFYKDADLSIGNDIDRCEQHIDGYKNIIENSWVKAALCPL